MQVSAFAGYVTPHGSLIAAVQLGRVFESVVMPCTK